MAEKGVDGHTYSVTADTKCNDKHTGTNHVMRVCECRVCKVSVMCEIDV